MHINRIKKLIFTVLILLIAMSVFTVVCNARCQHEWGKWQTSILPTSTAPGIRYRECQICHEAESVSITLPDNLFYDLKPGTWYYDAALYCYKYGYMAGSGEGKFDPDSVITRSMFVTILYKMDGATERYNTSSFKDIKIGTWYANAVEWAYRNGYTQGVSKDSFGPSQPVTREMLATFLYKYSFLNGVDVTCDVSLEFDDVDRIHSWALKGVKWVYECGFMTGSGSNNFSPLANTTRSQASLIVRNYCEKYGLMWDNGEVISKRTCKTAGKTQYTCLNDSDITMQVTYQAWHIWNNGVEILEPTCTTAGTILYSCSICQDTKTEVAKALGHDWSPSVVTKKATCTTEGEKTYTCMRCQQQKKKSIAALGHSYVHYHCIRCNTVTEYNGLLYGTWNGVGFYLESEQAKTLYPMGQNSFKFVCYEDSSGFLTLNGTTYRFNWSYQSKSNDVLEFVLYNSNGDHHYVYFQNGTDRDYYLHSTFTVDGEMCFVCENSAYYWVK